MGTCLKASVMSVLHMRVKGPKELMIVMALSILTYERENSSLLMSSLRLG